MMNPLLKDQLHAVFRRQRRMRLAWQLALCWGALALVALGIKQTGMAGGNGWLWFLALLAAAAGVVVCFRNRRPAPDWLDLARRIEQRHPELNGLLLTAVQQEPAEDGQLHYLQRRVLQDAVLHGHRNRWPEVISLPRVISAQCIHLLALAGLLGSLAMLRIPGHSAGRGGGTAVKDGIAVTPGDVVIERGERLVVMATFGGDVPAQVELVVRSDGASERRISLVKSLADPIFGGSVPEVVSNLVYHVEYGGKKTRDYSVKVFEYPRLERADVELKYPEYTRLEPKRIENTRRISAVEGAQAGWTLHLNKPVMQARLVVRGDAGKVVPLTVVSNQPLATVTGLLLETNCTYLLQLVDDEGRTNKAVTQFVFDVQKNREPELKIVSPHGDSRPSALEEVSFEGTVWDDFGVQAYGLAFARAGEEIKFVELGQAVPAREKHPFKHLLRLEDLGVKPDELITWFIWAEDAGPDGLVRRTAGDLYFAEVRPFDEIFRQAQNTGGRQQQNPGEDPQNSGNGGGGGSPQTQLAELQKQIINATWKLQRQQSRDPARVPEKPVRPEGKSSSQIAPPAPATALRADLEFMAVRPVVFGQRTPGRAPQNPLQRVGEKLDSLSGTNQPVRSQFAQDLKVVRDAIQQAITQAGTARQQQQGVREAALWDELIREMEKSRDALDKAAESQPTLEQALAAERSAFQLLLRLQQREYEITRNRNRNQNQGNQNNQNSRNRQMQSQLDQLDLTQPENRYENERLAQSPQNQERREQLQVMNRLGELARRQEDLNSRLQELQTALAEAKTPQQREELQRQLKRLQEEQQQMLADADELQQRMNQGQNQQNMNEQRQQLEQTRQQMQRSSEAAQQGEVSQALASGTRAQRELEQMREQMRRQNASAFSEDLKQLRAEAREVERRQQEIQKQVDALADGTQKSLDDSKPREQALEQLARQSARLTNLVARATELSQQTEEAEPVASRELYDTLRNFSQKDQASVRRLEDELIERGLVRSELYRRLTQMEKGDGIKSVELTQEMVRQGLLPQAQQAGETAQAAINELRRGIEAAAEKVVGDDADALRRAEQQLEQLAEQLRQDFSPDETPAGTNRNGQTAAGTSGRSSDRSQTNRMSRAGDQAMSNLPDRNGQLESPAGGGPNPTGQNAQAQNEERGRDGNRNPGQDGERRPARDGASPGANETETTMSGAPSQNQSGNRGPRSGRPPQSSAGLPPELQEFLSGDQPGAGSPNSPVITGENFTPWSDRLREIEEMVEDSALQGQLAAARERARQLRQNFKGTGQAPQWTEVQSQVVKPLVEVRNQIAEELARRGPRENLVPIDRDPVPNRFAERVRRYYEELGKDK